METIGGMIFFVGIIFCIAKSNSFEGFFGRLIAFVCMLSPMFLFSDGFQRGFAIFKFSDVLIFSIMTLVGGFAFLGSCVNDSKIVNGISIALICVVVGMWGMWTFSEDQSKIADNNNQNNYQQNYNYGNYNNYYTGSYANYPNSNNYSYNTQANNNAARVTVKDESGGTFREILIEGLKKYGAELVCAVLIAITAFVLSKTKLKNVAAKLISKNEILKPDNEN